MMASKIRSELRPIRVLSLDEFIGGSEQEIRIAEVFHHQQGLRVADHTVRGQPGAQFLLASYALRLDALVLGIHILAGALFEQAGRHGLH